VTLLLGNNIIKCKRVFKVKPKIDKIVEMYNAKHVAKSSLQVYGVDCVHSSLAYGV
jgi:hypothetical protein